MEILDEVDENGVPTGRTIDRITAHEKGIRHRTAHVWILRRKDSVLQVLLQKRSENKDSFPGCFDCSSAGHIPAGVDYIPSALRELEEELGVKADAEDLIFCGQRKFHCRNEFYGKTFEDYQVSNIYLIWLDSDAEEFCLQREELSEVRWFDFSDCLTKVENHEIPNCIYMEELLMVQKRATELL